MRFQTKKILRTLAATLAVSGTLIGGSVALANTLSGNVTLIRGYTVESDKKVEKTTASGSNAKITINDAIYYQDSVSVNIRNKNDNVVSAEPATFSGTTSSTTKSIKYIDGKGKKGNPFYPIFTLSSSSISERMNINFTFTP